MPSYEVFEQRTQKLQITGTNDSLKTVWNRDYVVQVTLSGAETIANIVAFNVMTATGLPVVNRSIYEINNMIIPFVICRKKTCKPLNAAYTRWTVSTEFESTLKQNNSEALNEPIAKPAALTDITPRVVPVFGEAEKVLYVDYSTDDEAFPPRTVGLECARTPSKNWWTEPVMEKLPTLALQITQYEDYVSYENLLERKFSANEEVYRGQPRFDWIVSEIEPTEVVVQLSSGPVTAVQITYTVAHSPHQFGWKEDRALIDAQYIDNPNEVILGTEDPEIKLFQNDQPGTKSIGFIDINGGRRADQTGIPDYIQYEQQKTLDYSTFLQV
tara:strand:+ start:2118 stop:3101 length:984 start_codon:yes stop_codon:yes gene_type:complete